MIIEVMCRIADGPLRPGELEISQVAVPLVTWSVNTHDVPEALGWQGKDLAIELHFADSTVWTGEVYPEVDVEPGHPGPGQQPGQEPPVTVRLRGIGALSENSTAIHADVVRQRVQAMLGEPLLK